jgi:GAF domain
MAAPFSSFDDPELSPLVTQLAQRREQFAERCLVEQPAALIAGLPVRLTELALRSSAADEGSIWLAVEGAQSLLPVWNNGPDAERFVGRFKLPTTAGISGFVFTSGISACEAEVCFHQRQHRELDRQLGVLTWAMLAVPLHFGGVARGVITAVRLIRLKDLPECQRMPESSAEFPTGYQPPAAFSVADLRTMETVASAVGRLVEQRLTAWALGLEEQS